MNKLTPFLILAIAIFFSSCKKEQTTWNTDWAAPVAYGHLTINDMIPVDYTTTNGDGYLSFVYHEPVYSFKMDTLITVPDTNLVNKYAIGLPSFNFNPGAVLPTTLEQIYNMGDIQLKRVIVKSGTGYITMLNTWPGLTYIGFDFPKVFENGGTFSRGYVLEAGSIANPTESNETIDMAGFDMDLTGLDGTAINTLYADFEFGSAETTDIITVTNSDTLYYIVQFVDVVPEYARGYFGQHHITDTIGLSFAPVKKILSGTVDLDSIDMTLTIQNGFKIFSQTKITKLTGINSRTNNSVDLNFSHLNTSINVNPASGGYYDWAPSEYPININNTNSTIIPFLENIPDSIDLGFIIDVNPYGNTSGGNDEIFPGSKMDLFLDAEFPVNFGANDLVIEDTIDISYTPPESSVPKSGNFVIEYVNAFPVDADAVFTLVDENGDEIDEITANSGIVAGTYDDATYLTNPYSGSLTFTLNASQVQNLELADKMVLNITFNSDQGQMVKIQTDAYFDFNLRTNLNIQVKF